MIHNLVVRNVSELTALVICRGIGEVRIEHSGDYEPCKACEGLVSTTVFRPLYPGEVL